MHLPRTLREWLFSWALSLCKEQQPCPLVKVTSMEPTPNALSSPIMFKASVTPGCSSWCAAFWFWQWGMGLQKSKWRLHKLRSRLHAVCHHVFSCDNSGKESCADGDRSQTFAWRTHRTLWRDWAWCRTLQKISNGGWPIWEVTPLSMASHLCLCSANRFTGWNGQTWLQQEQWGCNVIWMLFEPKIKA